MTSMKRPSLETGSVLRPGQIVRGVRKLGRDGDLVPVRTSQPRPALTALRGPSRVGGFSFSPCVATSTTAGPTGDRTGYPSRTNCPRCPAINRDGIGTDLPCPHESLRDPRTRPAEQVGPREEPGPGMRPSLFQGPARADAASDQPIAWSIHAHRLQFVE